MVEHLSKEKLNSLFTHQLRGKEFVQALKHIEICEECRNNYPKLSAQEIIQRLFDDSPQTIESRQEKSPLFFSNWKLIPLGSALVLLMIGGVSFWLINSKYGNAIEKNEIVKIENSNQLPVWQDTASNNAVNNSNSTPQNESLLEPDKTSNPVIKNESPKNSLLASETKKDVNKSVKSASENISRKAYGINDERKELQKFLTSIPLAVAGLRSTVSSVRSGENHLKGLGLAPFGEVVRDAKVNFRWANIKDAVSYEITVFDKAYNEIANEIVPTNSFRLKNALKRGKLYFWKLIATNSKGENLPAQNSKNISAFKVAEEKTIQQLNKIEQSKNADWKTINFLLKNGMLTEAKNKLGDLSTRFPKDPLIKKLNKRIEALLSN